jgi:hypothetical protein
VHGSVTFGPQVTPPPVNMGFNPGAPPLGRVTAWQESFTITSGATTITGTAALDDSALTMEGWFSYGVCVDRAATYGPQTLDFRVLGRYSATITSPAGSVRDQGAMQAMILPAYDANQPQTVIQLAFLSNLVTASTPPRDSTPPTFVGVKAIVVDAKSPAGAVVRYDVTATDEIDPQPTVACTPASGGTFPIGSTTVECSARDAAGNADVVRFAITVLGAQDQLTAVQSQVAAVTPAALARALGGLADDALQSLRLGSKRTACVDLQILAAQASARPEVGGDVAVGAERIRRVIGC